ncbi:uncharacterized protein [Elaeis guineensis]|uniref:uncharacterized protein isoform X1 n=1 Tax=Elaeis guineensis var. tenera TaxID=51953 RepID=UPI003C6D5657
MKFIIQDDQTNSDNDIQEETNERDHGTQEFPPSAYQPSANPCGQSSLLGRTPASRLDAGGSGSIAFPMPNKFTSIRPSHRGSFPPRPAVGHSRDQPITIDDDDDEPLFLYERPQPPPIFAHHARFGLKRKRDQNESIPYHPQRPPQYARLSADSNDTIPEPLGYKCQLCNIDLAFRPRRSSSDPVPVHVVLPCGHCYHSSCFEEVHGCVGKDEIPPCFRCSQGGD